MSLANNFSVFTTSIKNLPDLAKNYLFQVIFEYESGSVLSQVIGTDDFMLRAKTASLPQKDFNELTTEYMGSKLVYPGNILMIIAAIWNARMNKFSGLPIYNKD